MGIILVLHMFHSKNNSWCEQAKLLGSKSTAEAVFGWSVCLSGDTALVGAGRMILLTKCWRCIRLHPSNDTWTQQHNYTRIRWRMRRVFRYGGFPLRRYRMIGTPGDHINGSYSGSAYLFRRQVYTLDRGARLYSFG